MGHAVIVALWLAAAGCRTEDPPTCHSLKCTLEVRVFSSVLAECFPVGTPLPAEVQGCAEARADARDCVLVLHDEVDPDTLCCTSGEDTGEVPCVAPSGTGDPVIAGKALDFGLFIVRECGLDRYEGDLVCSYQPDS